MSNYHSFIICKLSSWKENLLSSLHCRIIRMVIIGILILIIFNTLQNTGLISSAIFQSVCISVILLSVTVGWDWIKNTRYYRNMAMLIALELRHNYLELHIAESALVNYPVKFKTDNWAVLQYELAKYMPTSEYQKLYLLYSEMLPELQDTRNLLNYSSRLDTAISSVEKTYRFMQSELRGQKLPTLRGSLHLVNPQKARSLDA